MLDVVDERFGLRVYEGRRITMPTELAGAAWCRGGRIYTHVKQVLTGLGMHRPVDTMCDARSTRHRVAP